MKRLFCAILLGAATAVLPFAARAATDIHIMWYSDGNEGTVVADLLGRFEKANPDIHIVLDQVPYKTITETLPAQVSSGQAPDMARITDLGGQAKYYLNIEPYLKDAGYWKKTFASTLPWTRPPGKTDGIYGLPTQLTVTLPFVNATLFQQAGIKLPGPKTTWEEWGKLAKEVAQKTNTPIPIAIDRSGYRIASLAIAMGAKFFNGDTPEVTDPGFKAAMKLLYDWNLDGTMSKQIWGSVGGATYRGATEEFANGQVVLYVSGNWQIPQFAKTIGSAFDWHAVPNPCGPASCTGMPGGAELVGYAQTKHPKEVARIMDYLASPAVYEEYHARTLFLTSDVALAKKGIPYKSNLPAVKESLTVGAAEAAKLSPIAIRLAGYAHNRDILNPMIIRLNQAIAGEMTLDEALARMSSDLAAALKAQAMK